MERRNFNPGTVAGVIVLIVLALGFGGMLLFEKIDSENKMREFDRQQAVYRQEKREKEDRIAVELEKVNAVIQQELPEIICWGDEYTLGTKNGTMPEKLETEINNNLFGDINQEIRTSANLSSKALNINVVNNGIRGEDMYTMAARIGAFPILTAEKLVLPKSTAEVQLTFKTNDDIPVRFMSQSSLSLGECVLDDEPGSVTLKKIDDSEYEYYFSKNSITEEKNIDIGTRMFTEGEETYRDDVLVMFFGREDLTPRKDLIEIQQAVINHQNAYRDKYIVVAQTGNGSGYDKSMKAKFGDHYLRLDPYDYDQTDNEEVAVSVYKKLEALGYFSKISEAAVTAKQQIDQLEK